MMQSRSRRIVRYIGTGILLLVIFVVGVFVGVQKGATFTFVSVLNAESEDAADVDFAPFWDTWAILDNRFPFEEVPTGDDRLWGAVGGLVEAYGDPYTVFFPPEELALFEETITGEFLGVGIEIGERDGILTVISPLRGTPAEEAGMRSGDLIIEIDGTSTADMTVDEAVQLIRGERGTDVVLTVLRESTEERLEIAITRDVIAIPILESSRAATEPGGKEDVYVISLYSFSEGVAQRFDQEMQAFATSGLSKLIIDLRGNPGGYLNDAIDMAGWFIEKGRPVLQEDFGPDTEAMILRSRGGKSSLPENLAIVVLQDQGSASASEILAGALQEYDKALIVGETSFGKGSVQELIPVTSDTAVKITVARWLTPNGVSISEGGLAPDVEVILTPEDIENDRDPQFDKALELLK